jgi:Protein of unknown function (DUF3619)
MNEKQFGFRIKQTLNRGLSLDEEVLGRLKSARLKALEKQQTTAPSLVYATGRKSGQINDEPRSVSARILLPLLMLVLGLYASNHWYQAQLQEEIIEIDTEVLTGDLPMDAYLDKGFDAWLKRSSD